MKETLRITVISADGTQKPEVTLGSHDTLQVSADIGRFGLKGVRLEITRPTPDRLTLRIVHPTWVSRMPERMLKQLGILEGVDEEVK